AGFLGAYAPYAASSDYTPQIYGVMSRTNGCGALIAGLLWACGLCALPRGTARRVVLGLVAGAFTWSNWFFASQWAESWTLQQDILKKAGVYAVRLPENATVLLGGAPSFVGQAIVFD